MLLCLEAQLSPGSDLGYLLHKHPERVFQKKLSAGQATLFYPEIGAHQATAALWLDIDPIGLVRRKDAQPGPEGYVNDRPYVASSYVSVALREVLASALKGQCPQRPELAEAVLPLRASLSVVAVRGGPELLESLFGPLGYQVEAERLPLDPQFPEWGDSPYYRLAISGQQRLGDLLRHLYVLLPVLDRRKHYWIDHSEVEKLLASGAGWLASHPAQALIVRRYLQDRPSLTRQALERLLNADGPAAPPHEHLEAQLEKPLSLNEQRMERVVALLKASGAQRVVDLGCGEGRVLKRLLTETRIPHLIGVDVASRELEKAERRLKLTRQPDAQSERVQLLQGSALYRDRRLDGAEAVLLIEVIEHLEPFQLDRLARTLLGAQRPPLVLLSTPNREYNAVFGMAPDQLRHSDHRFEWTRAEFADWTAQVGSRFGYTVEHEGIGEAHPDWGPPTQLAILRREVPHARTA
ncbi:MAG: 3' terminal RNA ribose 2'-O-methyltransferase Hen1 [Candidatus Sericytochromatia bacterium]